MTTDKKQRRTRKLAKEVAETIKPYDLDVVVADDCAVILPADSPEDLSLEIKVALTKAEFAIKKLNMPVDVVFLSLLKGLAERCDGYIELTRKLLSFEPKEPVISYYLSANFSSHDIFKWLEAAGMDDNEIVYDFMMSDVWRGTEYGLLSDEELINYILACGWQQPRQMAAMINNSIITKWNIGYLAKLNGSNWILEMIAKSGVFNDHTLAAVQSLEMIDQTDTRKKTRQWTKFKIWKFWKELGISDKEITRLFLQAMGNDGVFGLVEFFRSLPEAEDEKIISNLVDLGISLERITIAYLPTKSTNSKIESRLLRPEFINALKKLGKSDKEIVELLIRCEFTLYMIANNLLNSGWNSEMILTAMIDAGCSILFINKMLDEATVDSEKNVFWRPEIVRHWKGFFRNNINQIASQYIFGKPEISK